MCVRFLAHSTKQKNTENKKSNKMREEDGEDEVRYGKRANTCARARAHKPEMENRRHSPTDTHNATNERRKKEKKND